jgi:hypothetical protein
MSFEPIPKQRAYAKRSKGVRVALRAPTGRNVANLCVILGPEVQQLMGWERGTLLEIRRGRGSDEGRVRVRPSAIGNKLRAVTNSSVSLQVSIAAWDELGSTGRKPEPCVWRVARDDPHALDITLPDWTKVPAFTGGALCA